MGTDHAIESLRGSENLMLIDRPTVSSQVRPWQLPVVLGSIAAVILTSSLNILPIHLGALVACLVLFFTGCLKPKEGYRAVEWSLLILIYGMLAVGLAMEHTGTTTFLVDGLLSGTRLLVAPEHQALVMLAVFYVTTSILTEILSNNAVAALMAPLALGLAAQLGVDARPFIIAVCIAASCSFATPIGYQTNTYVYGVGGYRFADFLKFGLPMNFLCFAVFICIVPIVWPFVP
jgi:di/tricarboxylate transporter